MSERYLVANLAYGCGSWGDEMVLAGVLEGLGRENCTVFSADPDETRTMHGVEAVGLNTPIGLTHLWIGGGGWGYPVHVPGIADLVDLALRSGVAVSIEAAGLRPEVDWQRWAPIFSQVTNWSVRDATSQSIVRRYFGREAAIVPDPSQRMRVELVELPPGRWLGVNVVNRSEALELLVPLVQAFAAAGWRLVALPTIAHKKRGDLDGHEACRRLAEMANVPILDVPGPWYKDSLGPAQLAGLAANCRAVIAMRKHGCWAAARVGVPVLMVDYYADHGATHRLRQLRDVMPDSRYCDLHAGQDPLSLVENWLDRERGG